MRSKKEREKIKAREEERSPSTFHRFLYSSPLSTISERLEQAIARSSVLSYRNFDQ